MWINRNGRRETTLHNSSRRIAALLFRTASPKCYECAGADQEVLYRAVGVQRLLKLNDVIRLLRSEVERAGSQRAFARKAGQILASSPNAEGHGTTVTKNPQRAQTHNCLFVKMRRRGAADR